MNKLLTSIKGMFEANPCIDLAAGNTLRICDAEDLE